MKQQWMACKWMRLIMVFTMNNIMTHQVGWQHISPGSQWLRTLSQLPHWKTSGLLFLWAPRHDGSSCAERPQDRPPATPENRCLMTEEIKTKYVYFNNSSTLTKLYLKPLNDQQLKLFYMHSTTMHSIWYAKFFRFSFTKSIRFKKIILVFFFF